MSLLDSIGILRNTDKSSLIHNYCVKYEKYLPFKRTDKLKILEIGVLNGESLRMWKDYYVSSNIIGIDITKEAKVYEEERIKIEIGSQTDPTFLNQVTIDYGMFDMIVDDGSHVNNDVIFSFQHLFEHVKPGGIYVVEDACTSYWSQYGGTLRKKGTTMEYFKDIIDEVNYAGEILENFDNIFARREDLLDKQFEMKGYDNLGMKIESINFLNSLIIITKKNVTS
jgi:hypothetical protein